MPFFVQVKGLSFEYDKLSLTSQREHINSENNKTGLDSSSRPKQNGSTDTQFPSTSFSPLPYITCHYRQTNAHSEQHSSASPDGPRNKKTHHNSPNTPVSDTLGVRASVLRDGSRPERESPLSLTTYHSQPTSHLENSHQPQSNNSGDGTTLHNYRNVTSNNCGEGIYFVCYLLL